MSLRCGREVVAVARVAHARLGRERGAAQHRPAVEPGRRIVAVGVRREAGVGREGAGRPFPDVAPAEVLRALQRRALPTRPRWAAGGRPRRTRPGPRAASGGRRAGPGPAPASGRGATAASRRRRGAGSAAPAACVRCQPGAAGGGPPAGLGVAAGFDEGQELGPAQRLAVDAAGRERDLVRAEFVVEGEARAGVAQPPAARRRAPGRRRAAAAARAASADRSIGTPSACAM